MEFDHADIYDNIGDIIRQFHYLLRSVPANGAVVVNADSNAACKAMQMGIYSPPVWFNAGGKKNNHNWHWHFDGKQMTVFDGGRLRCSLQPPLAGSANRDNITAALAAASFAGVDISCASELLKDYRRRRPLQTRRIMDMPDFHNAVQWHNVKITRHPDRRRHHYRQAYRHKTARFHTNGRRFHQPQEFALCGYCSRNAAIVALSAPG